MAGYELADISKAEAFSVKILTDRPDRRKRDIDNFIKPVVDVLVKSGRVPDDHKMKSVLAEWRGFNKNVRVLTVEVEVVEP